MVSYTIESSVYLLYAAGVKSIESLRLTASLLYAVCTKILQQVKHVVMTC